MNKQTIPVNAQLLLIQQEYLNSKLDQLHNILNSTIKGNFGLTPDHAKTPEWMQAKQDWNKYFNQLRAVNQQLNKVRKPTGFEVKDGKRITIYKYI